LVTHRELVRKVLRDRVLWFACGFGTGLLPVAPGRWGSLRAIVCWWFLPKDLLLQASVAGVGFMIGIWLWWERARRLGEHDRGGIVWDEIVGMFLTLMVIPPEPVWILAAFVLFRVADIWKPWPIRDLDHRLGGGLGIMLDDVLAALYAAILLGFMGFFWF